MSEQPSFNGLPWLDRIRLAAGAPSAFYMTGEDALQLTVACSAAGVRVRVSGRFLGFDGVPRPFSHDILATNDRVVSSLVRALGEGWLLNLHCAVVSGTTAYGSCWARVQVVRGLAASGIVLGTLCAGYVTSVQVIAFPGGRIQNMVEGPGNIRSITGTDPAAGAEMTETVPTGARWKLLALSIRFVTDATVVNRLPVLQYDDGTTIHFASDPEAAQVASLDHRWVTGPAIARLGAAWQTRQWAAPAPVLLAAGSRIRTATDGIQAGDNWGAPQLLVEEWIDAP